MTRDTLRAEDILRRAHAVGQYYGFTPLTALAATARGQNKKAEYPETMAGVVLDPLAELVAGFLKHCRALVPSARTPLFLWHSNIAPGRPAPRKVNVQFHALGSDRPLADALVIRALVALTRDLTGREPVVRINSMGDKETRARYARELGNFFKKRAQTLPEECVNSAKHDVFAAAELAVAKMCAEDLPSPTDHLSDQSRKRFEELLEYLERTKTPYELSHTLISRGPSWSETCFEISAAGERVAWGSRYGDLARHFFKTLPTPAVGAVLHVAALRGAVAKAKKPPRLRFAFVHIGDEAKQLSLGLAEEFKKARLALSQDIGLESLAEQMHLVERRNPSYLLIMGRKEALEHSAILRNRLTQEEWVLPLAKLTDRLRSIG
ncbi:hypothetical protein HY091_02220 [Candidatus Kaiserbacteria bacterium]|nr:hypothetical protein [Candidatus Kaiserbacteria bacterium]